MRPFSSLHAVFSAISLFLFVSIVSAQPTAPPTPAKPATGSDASIRLLTDIASLTAFPSRVPGTPGNLAAAKYVQKRFQEIGLSDVRADTFTVTAPITKSASIAIAGQNLPILPVYPNHIAPSTTPPEGITGPLVYAGVGQPRDFNGQKVQDSIVVLDFNSGLNWITAADLGARAIVFLEAPGVASRGEAERKFSWLPVEVPRFYAPGATATAIKGSNGQIANLKSLVTWERVNTQNVLGFLKGRNAPQPKNKDDKVANTLIVSGYFDSMAFTPDLAPGAEAAGNCAALLELARRFKANPPAYNVLFVANGSHHLALAGMRNFVAQHLVDKDGKADDAKKAEMGSYRAFFGLDLTSQTSTIGMFAKSSFYDQMNKSESILLNQFAPLAKVLGRYADDLAKKRNVQSEAFFVDGVTGKDGRTWRSYLPSLVALDSEVATMAALPGISFATANDARLLQDTPSDTAANLKIPNLEKQIETVELMLRRSIDEIATSEAKKEPVLPTSSTLSKNFGFMTGRAIYRDVLKASSFLPDTPLPDDQLPTDLKTKYNKETKQTDVLVQPGTVAVGAVVSGRSGLPQEYKSYSGVRGVMIERAQYSKAAKDVNPVAQFVFTGPRVGDPKGGGTPQYEFEAYSLDRNGHIIFAPDLGSERQRFSPNFNKATGSLSYKDEKTGQLNVDASLITFPCRAVSVFDTLDQRYFSVLREMSVLDARTDANPVEYGYLRPNAGPGVAEIEPIAMLFAHPEDRFKLIMAAGLLGKRLVLLQTNPPTDPNVERSPKNETIEPEQIRPESQDPTASLIQYEGAGFAVQDGPTDNRIMRIAYQTALDLWILDQQRIRLLKGFGINNERVDRLHGDAGCPLDAKKPKNADGSSNFDCPKASVTQPTGGSLLLAQQAFADMKYGDFYEQSRRAFGLESRAYPDIEATSQDVLKGIIFYLALLLPFSYFVERMLFGFPDVRKQIVGTSIVFLAIFTAIRFVHPAFELALTPFIILLAFIILALTVVVTAFLQGKFEQEIKRLKQGVHYADVGRLSALGAALGLGIANMRRRPTRTALTCVTLILLTFTVLSFTSVTANITNFARPYGEGGRLPAYQGFLVRQPDWSAMPEVAVSSLSNEFGRQFGNPALRAWYLSRDQGEPLQLRTSNAENPDRYFYAPALLGLTPAEKEIGSPIVKTVYKGRWFEPGDTDVCLLPRDVLLSDAQRNAERPNPTEKKGEEDPNRYTGPPLGLTEADAVGSHIQIAGKNLEVIGIFDDRQWYGRKGAENLRDLDNEEFTPVDYSSDSTRQNQTSNQNASAQGGEVQVQRYEHMPANALLVLPYQTALNMGATTRSVAVGIADAKLAQEELNDLMQRAALGIFGATPDLDANGEPTGPLTARLYSSVEGTSYEGFAALFVPILIAAMIIANTMLGSVYERTREIGIYSSVGLAPVHVAALFIAEAAVYAVLGSISGYLIAQVTAKVITALELLPGITLNYSSSSAVLSTLIVMLTVLLSTLYPAWAASRLSQPDIERKWSLSEPTNDVWRFQFPFTVSGNQPMGVAQFLSDFFETHTDTSVGKFYTDKVNFNSLTLREAVDVLNNGVELPAAAVNGTANGHANGKSKGKSKEKSTPLAKTPPPAQVDNAAVAAAPPPVIGGPIALESIAGDPDMQVYRIAMRTWLAPFDMGVSQDTDIVLLPSAEPGLYELQLRLERQSGEIAAWKRVNREFMSDLRKQLLLWRTIKPEGQQEYILRGRAHVRGEKVPTEEPGAVVG